MAEKPASGIEKDICECGHLACEHFWNEKGFVGKCSGDECLCEFWRHVSKEGTKQA